MSRYQDSTAVKIEQLTADPEELLQPVPLTGRKPRKRLRPYGKYLTMLACAFAVLLLILHGYTQLSVTNLENSRLRQQITKLESEENALNAKKEQIYNLAYVEAYARDTLGMVKTDKSQMNYVEMDTGDQMVLTDQVRASMPGAESAGFIDKIVQAFSVVLEYLN